jgi:hypothetical protein
LSLGIVEILRRVTPHHQNADPADEQKYRDDGQQKPKTFLDHRFFVKLHGLILQGRLTTQGQL